PCIWRSVRSLSRSRSRSASQETASNPHFIYGGVGVPVPIPTTKEVAMFGHTEPSGEEIARRAHELYVQRGGEHGKDVEDWVAAEKDLTDKLVVEEAKARAAQARHQAVN